MISRLLAGDAAAGTEPGVHVTIPRGGVGQPAAQEGPQNSRQLTEDVTVLDKRDGKGWTFFTRGHGNC